MNESDGSAESIGFSSRDGHLDSRYDIQVSKELPEYSSEFAKACAVSDSRNQASSDSLYALIFNENFPSPIRKIDRLKKNESPYMADVVDSGIGSLSATGAQRYIAIVKKPEGKKLSDIIKEGMPLDDSFIMQNMVDQLNDCAEHLSKLDVIHGSINLDTIYLDKESGNITVKQCISEFTGYSQNPAFETIDRLTCNPAGKGDGDFAADYFSIGMVVASLLLNKEIFSDMKKEDIIKERFKKGTVSMVITQIMLATGRELPTRTSNLLKGLLNDFSEDRWQAEEVSAWLKRQDVPAPPVSKIHKQAQTGMIFDDEEYFSRKHLAYDIFLKWNTAKTGLRLADLSRWCNLALKKPDISEQIDMLSSGKSGDVILSDDKVFAIITILDPTGPIRFKGMSTNIFGIGGMLAYSYIKGERDYVQNIGTVINEGLVEYWVRRQKDPDYYSYSVLSWSPVKIRQYVRKKEIGFGMERVLYELNRSLACQSSMMGSNYVTTLTELLNTLDRRASNRKEDSDPVDRHIAGFIAASVNLMEDIRIKSLQNFPDIAKNRHVIMVGLLAVAQSHSSAKSLKGLTEWLNDGLSSLIDTLHSRLIKRDIKSKLKQASKDGNVNSLFKIISSPIYVKRDAYGFHEAKMQYRAITAEIFKLKKQSNIERMAYKIGLRVAVAISYLVCTVTMLYVFFQQS